MEPSPKPTPVLVVQLGDIGGFTTDNPRVIYAVLLNAITAFENNGKSALADHANAILDEFQDERPFQNGQ